MKLRRYRFRLKPMIYRDEFGGLVKWLWFGLVWRVTSEIT